MQNERQNYPDTRGGRWIYMPPSEDIPVTFQIGMVGEDGVLLASDRGHVRLGEGRTTFSSQKLTITGDGNIAYCCAGDDFTQLVAEEIVKVPRSQISRTTRDHLLLAVSEAHRRAIGQWKTGGSILAAYRRGDDVVDLFRIVIYSKELCPIVNLIDNRDFQGDAVNPAAYFIERYLPSAQYVRLPIDRLKVFSVHTIAMATMLNPIGINGIDLAVCRPGRPFEMVSEAEIADLNRDSQRLDSTMTSLLGL